MCDRRNEEARARRRTQIKQALSLTSVPRSEENAEGVLKTPTLTLNNHFGWKVIRKSQIGDGVFPHLFHFYEKPDLHGRDFDKVTYVLYMDKGTVVDKKVSLKETQTTVSGILIKETPTPPRGYRYDEPRVEQLYEREIQPERSKVVVVPEEKLVHAYLPDRRKKKKLISEFYYIKRDRSRSRSVEDRNKGGYSDADSEWQNPPISKTNLSHMENEVSELEMSTVKDKDRAALVWREIKDEKEKAIFGKARSNTNAKIHKLRAGAEKIDSECKKIKEKNEKATPIEKNKSSKVVENNKFKTDKNEITEELLKTSSGTNQYLYVSGKHRLR